MTNSDLLWQCRTPEGYVFKILVEIIANACKSVCFHVRESPQPSVYARFTDTQELVLYDLDLDGMEWSVYPTEEVSLGVNTKHLHTVLKSTKKRDVLTLSQDANAPEFLGIACFSQSRESHINVRTHVPQQMLIDIPPDSVYTCRATIPSSELQKTMKDLIINSTVLSIGIANECYVQLTARVDGIYTKSTTIKDMSTCGPERCEGPTDMSVGVDTCALVQFLKIASLGKQVTAALGPDLPLKLSVQMGLMGRMDIYVHCR